MAKIPKFKSLKEESDFWDTHSILEYLEDTEEVHGHFIDARPPKKVIAIRFDPDLIAATKKIARTKGVGYQTLLRMWAYDGLNRELREARSRQRKPRATRTKAG